MINDFPIFGIYNDDDDTADLIDTLVAAVADAALIKQICVHRHGGARALPA